MSRPSASPIYFGPENRRLFGWLHDVPAERRDIGIVLCNPMGYEAICTHRTYRHFAERAASLGFPCLRFDYDGTGNSAGELLDPDRMAAWLQSIDFAIDTLKSQAALKRICLFGVRAGAALAAVAAENRKDTHALIAFAPVIKMRSYLREIRALALARPQPAPPPDVIVDPTLQEAAGFPTSEETRSQLSKIDLLKLAATPTNILIFNRDDLPSDDALARALTAKGAHVEQQVLEGYVDMVRDAHSSQVPIKSIDAAIAWLQSLSNSMPVCSRDAKERRSPAVSEELHVSADASDLAIRETATFLGENRTLFGIISEPAIPHPSSAPSDVLILLNSGTIHHIGPGRLYVSIGRLFSMRGETVLRLDLSGVGESPARPGKQENTAYSDVAHLDIEEAIRFVVSRFGDVNVHLVGLCSGAYHGLKAAVAGLPLRSVVIINPLTFYWKEGMSLDFSEFHVTAETRRYSKTVFEWSAWLKLLRGKVDLAMAMTIFRKRFLSKCTHVAREIARTVNLPFKQDLASELRAVARKNIDMLFIFSASDPGLTMLREQGGRSVVQLSEQSALRIAVIEGADHTLTSRWHRDRLLQLLQLHIDRLAR